MSDQNEPNQQEQQIQEEQQFASLSEVNQILGGLKAFYTALILKGFYLPEYLSSCITSQYLLGVATGKFLSFKNQDITVACTLQNYSKLELFVELSSIHVNRQLGFDLNHLPDKKMAICKKKYSRPQQIVQSCITQQELSLLKQLKTSHFRTKKMRLFKATKEQREIAKRNKINQRIVQINNQIDIQKHKEKYLRQKAQELKEKINPPSNEQNVEEINEFNDDNDIYE